MSIYNEISSNKYLVRMKQQEARIKKAKIVIAEALSIGLYYKLK